MRFYLIIFIFLSLEYAYNNASSTHQNIDGNSDCLTDELYGDFTVEEYNNLVARRKLIRLKMKTNLFRNETDTLFVPLVFHNLYKIVNGEPVTSYCDYIKGFSSDSFEYTTGNDQASCNQRMLRSLKVLNGNYAPSGIQFVLHPDYPNMLHATDPGFDGFYERATDGTATSPEANALKEHYNIPNTLNIYIVDFIMNSDGKSGISSYPWSSGVLGGLFIKHGHLPGDVDAQSQADYKRTLMHEIGHYFGLLHTNGTWYVSMDTLNKREFVSGNDCNFNGDTICDTPAEPGMSNGAWYTNSNNRECIYHGFGGYYNSDDSTLQIGGYNNNYLYAEGDAVWEGYYPKYNYCGAWGIEDPFGLDHCKSFTNYDNVGDFFGTRDLNPDECNNDDQSEYATECHIDNYLYLPIGYNFMRAASSPYNDCGISPINDNIYYDETKQGFTEEQFANIKNSLELDYTPCSNEDACNTGLSIRKGIKEEYLLREEDIEDEDESSCLYPCNKQESEEYYKQFHPGCLITDAEYQSDYSQYECSENLSSLYKNIIPQNFGINQIYPNPFNPITTIRYGLTQNSDVQISIYDINGRLITTLINEFQITGYHFITWDASNYSSGIYFLNMSSGEISKTKKLVLIK